MLNRLKCPNMGIHRVVFRDGRKRGETSRATVLIRDRRSPLLCQQAAFRSARRNRLLLENRITLLRRINFSVVILATKSDKALAFRSTKFVDIRVFQTFKRVELKISAVGAFRRRALASRCLSEILGRQTSDRVAILSDVRAVY